MNCKLIQRPNQQQKRLQLKRNMKNNLFRQFGIASDSVIINFHCSFFFIQELIINLSLQLKLSSFSKDVSYHAIVRFC